MTGALWSYLPELSKENVMYLLLILLCWEGSVALAHLLKPFFSFALKCLPIGSQKQPRLNLPYEIFMTRGRKEVQDSEGGAASGDKKSRKKADSESEKVLLLGSWLLGLLVFCIPNLEMFFFYRTCYWR